jgi:MoaE-MoaD fusion protein
MNLRVMLFATLKHAAGAASVEVQVFDADLTVAALRDLLRAQHPALAPHIGTAIAAVNREFAGAETTIMPGDEVAFFPPVSGGQGWAEIVRLADAPFSLDALCESITTPATGAVCLFSGYVRGETQREQATRHTEWLEYEAYEAMALDKMRQVIAEIRAQWPLVQGVAVVQRVGRLEVGQNTIVIACASGHRDQGCFEAARYGIDRLKEIVPVWKKEVGRGGEAWVEGSYFPDTGDAAQDGRK